ncbi:beta-phosphoglucomutase [Lactococcus formosensis subsp. formosensis]|jgi:beta-phosphoglucomutase|uniref:Beta-phosphoglucomutase n=1 Tax=Lactococcus formosensis TaxID=1281486 RepID=A0A9Q9D7B9_9LACT|nr:beta-phosphoglucomutase [Lactococcus formosensis]NHI99272.1 beta-phosphoglucomutase [Lactococcus garvieae]MDT2725571.1 beta-phosphoglucomutase [Lactococcus formosensis]NHJ17409.1 beta-phosphoglucomutase [Lactococcus garvieae]USJ20889.1 beta-phosphoglucomutase [Lactococcus formosensis]BAV02217.1 Beta-phosphoglucomutase [Lactococcus formosensis]
MFKAVLFDLDGVITDTAEYHFQAWKALAEELGIDGVDRTFNEQLKGVSREDSLRKILELGGKLEAYDDETFAQLAQRKNDNYVQMIQKVGPDDIYPGILDLLKDLRAKNIKIALASASKNGPFLLEAMGLSSYFDAIADPAKVAASKPAPDIFLAAAAGVGVPITSCIGIEDAQAGITAIKAAGALPIGVGAAEDLGTDIALVSNTNSLSLELLTKVWENK